VIDYHRKLIEREQAAELILLSLISFAATVVLVRLFLELTGYPQVGGGTLHIAHLLWGGLALFIAVIAVLIWDNPGVLYFSAILSGVGAGLFMDEVGKFITQNNDYFFPAAAPIIYTFFLLFGVVYILVRRPDPNEPRRAIILALEQLQDAIYADLDEDEGKHLLAKLEIARHHPRPDIAVLAEWLWEYVAAGNVPFKDYSPSILQRLSTWFGALMMQKVGRSRHRVLIMLVLGVNAFSSLAVLLFFAWVAISPQATSNDLLEWMVAQAQQADAGGLMVQWVHAGLEITVGLVALIAIGAIIFHREKLGMTLALVEGILALTVLQILTFYMDQFTAVLPTLFQFLVLILVVSYQRWYLFDSPEKALAYFSRYQRH
jgi:hypothetical protein